MTKKHYIYMLHWFGWELLKLYQEKGKDKNVITITGVLKQLKEILGDDFKKTDYEDAVNYAEQYLATK